MRISCSFLSLPEVRSCSSSCLKRLEAGYSVVKMLVIEAPMSPKTNSFIFSREESSVTQKTKVRVKDVANTKKIPMTVLARSIGEVFHSKLIGIVQEKLKGSQCGRINGPLRLFKEDRIHSRGFQQR